MNALATVRLLGAALAPPRCGVCLDVCEPIELVCADCARTLSSARSGSGVIAGVGQATWAAPYEGVAADLIRALKFGGRRGLAEPAGEAVARAAGACGDCWCVVAVPASPLRRRWRAFDPAESIAAAVARHLGLQAEPVLARSNGPRQVGRPRAERVSNPSKVRALRSAPARVLLVDDVLTTGATLGSCAAALRGAGCVELRAAVFARS